MTSAQDIYRQLLAKAEGSPYSVTPTEGGLLVHLNVADMGWTSIFYQNGLNKEYSIELTLDETKKEYRKKQIIKDVTWRAGVNPGTWSPELKVSRNVQKGTFVEHSSHHVVGLDSAGRPGASGYNFDSTEMSRFVDDAMVPSGWTKKMDSSTKLGLMIAGFVGGGLVLAAVIVVLVLVVFRH